MNAVMHSFVFMFGKSLTQALVVLHMWLEKNKESATGNELERALIRIQRRDIIDKCMGNMQEVTDHREKKEALAQLREGSHLTPSTFVFGGVCFFGLSSSFVLFFSIVLTASEQRRAFAKFSF